VSCLHACHIGVAGCYLHVWQRVLIAFESAPALDASQIHMCVPACFLHLPAHAGGERALLEARACGAQVEVAEDNPKLQYLLRLSPVPDHHKYAKQVAALVIVVASTARLTTSTPHASEFCLQPTLFPSLCSCELKDTDTVEMWTNVGACPCTQTATGGDREVARQDRNAKRHKPASDA
jgi:hypothetical protein